MGFRKLQKKTTRGNFRDESETRKHWYITYELSSLFLNLSTGELCLQQCENKTEKEHWYITQELSSFLQNLSAGELCLQQCENKIEKGKKLKEKIIDTVASSS